jgi:hypothetical protein
MECALAQSMHFQAAILWVRRLVAGFSPRRPGFALTVVRVGFMMDVVILAQVSRQVLQFFPCQYHSAAAPYSLEDSGSTSDQSFLGTWFHSIATATKQVRSTSNPHPTTSYLLRSCVRLRFWRRWEWESLSYFVDVWSLVGGYQCFGGTCHSHL